MAQVLDLITVDVSSEQSKHEIIIALKAAAITSLLISSHVVERHKAF